jgi:hypothetical protein
VENHIVAPGDEKCFAFRGRGGEIQQPGSGPPEKGKERGKRGGELPL